MHEVRSIDGFPDYAVDEYGNVFNEALRCSMKKRVNNQGLVMVGLRQDGRQHMRSVARLVASAFVEPEHAIFNTVIHLNGDHEDCRALNLRWRTRPFAIQYHRMFDELPLWTSIYIPSTKERFSSLREACTKYGWVERMAFTAMENKEPVFPQGWIIEPYSR